MDIDKIKLYGEYQKKMNKKLLIIDADSLCFHSKNIMFEEDAIQSFKNRLQNICEATGVFKYELYFSLGKKNIRFSIDPFYKDNRSSNIRPIFYKHIKMYAIKEMDGIYEMKYEADDLVVDRYKENTDEHILVAIDKDVLYNVPGRHFDYYHMKFIDVSEEEAFDHFYTQFIIGDRVDNIPNLIACLGIKTLDKIVCVTNLTKREIGLFLCKLVGFNYKDRYRMLYCGKELPDINETIDFDTTILNQIFYKNKDEIVFESKLLNHLFKQLS